MGLLLWLSAHQDGAQKFVLASCLYQPIALTIYDKYLQVTVEYRLISTVYLPSEKVIS
jgi:hypothetical protein